MVWPCSWSAIVLLAHPMPATSSAASSMPSIRPDNTVMIWRCVTPPILPESAGAALVAESAMCLPLSPELLFVTSHQSRQLTLVVRGKTCEKFGELLALFRRPVRDNVGNGGIATLNAGLKERLAFICSSKHRHPAVIRISPTLHISVLDQLGHLAAHRGRVGEHQLGERTRPPWPAG